MLKTFKHQLDFLSHLYFSAAVLYTAHHENSPCAQPLPFTQSVKLIMLCIKKYYHQYIHIYPHMCKSSACRPIISCIKQGEKILSKELSAKDGIKITLFSVWIICDPVNAKM